MLVDASWKTSFSIITLPQFYIAYYLSMVYITGIISKCIHKHKRKCITNFFTYVSMYTIYIAWHIIRSFQAPRDFLRLKIDARSMHEVRGKERKWHVSNNIIAKSKVKFVVVDNYRGDLYKYVIYVDYVDCIRCDLQNSPYWYTLMRQKEAIRFYSASYVAYDNIRLHAS